MKYFALSAVVALAFAATTETFAQTKAAATTPEKGAATEMPGPEGTPGEMVILPQQSIPEAPVAEAPAKVVDEEEPVIKNVAHKRSKKIGKMTNGYYKMQGHRDWGTNATLNGFGYEQVAPAAPYYPEDDAPVFLAGDEEAATDGAAPAADWTDEPAATDAKPATTDAAKADAKTATKGKTSAKKSSDSSNGSYSW